MGPAAIPTYPKSAVCWKPLVFQCARFRQHKRETPVVLDGAREAKPVNKTLTKR